MAGGKENARQKMINLMYLVFIAMLALNMSKEVLMTFGEIDREVFKSTKSLNESNNAAILSVFRSYSTSNYHSNFKNPFAVFFVIFQK